MTDNNGWPGKPGVPLNPERDGWHWIKRPSEQFIHLWEWKSGPEGWCAEYGDQSIGYWLEAEGGGQPKEMAKWFVYCSPVLTPAEVDARIKEAEAKIAAGCLISNAAEVADLVPLNPERDGWHWFVRGDFYSLALWHRGHFTFQDTTAWPEEFSQLDMTYAGPALTPTEVDARVKEARRDALEEAARVAEELIGRPEWPIDELPEDTLRRVIRNCAIPTKSKRIKTEPRWSIVSQVTAHGSTYSAALCRWAGLDPDELVRKRP